MIILALIFCGLAVILSRKAKQEKDKLAQINTTLPPVKDDKDLEHHMVLKAIKITPHELAHDDYTFFMYISMAASLNFLAGTFVSPLIVALITGLVAGTIVGRYFFAREFS